MATASSVTERVFEELTRVHGCDLDTLRQNLPDLSWNQVFLEVDRLSRQGRVLVTYGTRGRYLIQLPDRQNASLPSTAPRVEPGALPG